MRVLLVNNLFDPEPSVRGLTFAKGLVERGHEVHVLTGFPNYPGGRVYPGYKMRWHSEERVEGVGITRVAMFPSHSGSGVARALSYVSTAASEALRAALWRKRFDVCHVQFGPIPLIWPALVARRMSGAKILADVQDIWPESVVDSGMLPPYAEHLVTAWSRWAYSKADRLVVLSPGYKNALVAAGISPAKVEVVFNWCDEGKLGRPTDHVPDNVLFPGAFNVVYAGNLGKLQGIDTILDAAKRVAASHPQVAFVLVGDGVESARLRKRIEGERIGNVRMTGRLAMTEVNAIQRKADLLLIHLEPTRLTRMAVPSKVQSCLASGAPILVAAEGDAASLVEQSGGGVVCAPRDAAAMAHTIMTFYGIAPDKRKRMGALGRDCYWSRLSLRAGVRRIEELMVEAVGSSQASGGAGVAPDRAA
jgi:colanic acid biosynthesis glycosyl transferase WcaI